MSARIWWVAAALAGLSAGPALAQDLDPNDPNSCKELIWAGLGGLPVSHKDPGALFQNVTGTINPPSVIICHDRFVVQYNCYTKNPDWVIEKLSVATTEGDNTRPKVKFQPEKDLPGPDEVAAPTATATPSTNGAAPLGATVTLNGKIIASSEGDTTTTPAPEPVATGTTVTIDGKVISGANVVIDTSNGVQVTIEAPDGGETITAAAATPTPAPVAAPEDSFDPCVSAIDRDYTSSGFARGHNAASADFKAEADWMKDTFVLSNAVPQVQNGFNGGIWKELEEHVQDLAKSLAEEDAIYVITGAVDLPADGTETVVPADQNACNTEIKLAGVERLIKERASVCVAANKTAGATCENGVAVPAGMYKIVYEPRMDRAFGFMFSNEDHRKLGSKNLRPAEYFEQWRASLDVIEETTNLNFFPEKSRRWRNIHETTCPATRWRQ